MRVDIDHKLISYEEAWQRFNKVYYFESPKISKSSVVNRMPPSDAQLAVLTISPGFEDLCWWNSVTWQYITSNVIKDFKKC